MTNSLSRCEPSEDRQRSTDEPDLRALGGAADALGGAADTLGGAADALGGAADALGGAADALGGAADALRGERSGGEPAVS